MILSPEAQAECYKMNITGNEEDCNFDYFDKINDKYYQLLEDIKRTRIYLPENANIKYIKERKV